MVAEQAHREHFVPDVDAFAGHDFACGNAVVENPSRERDAHLRLWHPRPHRAVEAWLGMPPSIRECVVNYGVTVLAVHANRDDAIVRRSLHALDDVISVSRTSTVRG
jgi:hypothetical protein